MTVILAVSVTAFVIVLLIIRFLWVQRNLSIYELVRSERFANFYGLSSLGPGQLRGNGWLALTPNSLIFELYLPAKSFIIPLDTLLSVDAVRTHLGKTGKAGSSLLRIRYLSGEHEEVAAWNVENPAKWIELIGVTRMDLLLEEQNLRT